MWPRSEREYRPQRPLEERTLTGCFFTRYTGIDWQNFVKELEKDMHVIRITPDDSEGSDEDMDDDDDEDDEDDEDGSEDED
jgi:hypothetical protein